MESILRKLPVMTGSFYIRFTFGVNGHNVPVSKEMNVTPSNKNVYQTQVSHILSFNIFMAHFYITYIMYLARISFSCYFRNLFYHFFCSQIVYEKCFVVRIV